MIKLKDQVIGVVMGGVSAEREVSIKSGKAVAEALRSLGYSVREVEVDAGAADQLREARIDVAFLTLHGGWGEDGRVQALCEMLRIHYTGSGVLASGLAMNKPQAKAIFVQRGIPTPAYCPALSRAFVFDQMEFRVPLVVKPSAEGSTFGITIVRKEDEFDAALTLARSYDDTPMAEEYIPGREITAGVLGGEPLGVVEIIPREGFYDYEHKYTRGATEYVAPAELSSEMTERVRALGAAAYGALGCRGAARVDFRLDPERGPFVLEVNTIPGMTPLSLLPMSADVMGIGFAELCERMLKSAVEGK
ncbi:MAG TPA: D-alanine--D-alanine ligase [bacterium]|nr:D-alanine--D-alanine ligase [bacterium]